MSNNFVKNEEGILKFWDKSKTFEKSVNKEAPHGDYVFYDGPPFATGTPHYGHIVASVMKDAVPRYWTMKGFRVERKWGWDCHGLPIENIVEKEIGSKAKKDIVEKIGVAKFNEMCRSKVLDYVDEWKKVIRKIGRWADMENSYKTMDLDFMESVWYVFKELYDKGLIYEGYRSMHICPRCETTLSQSEVAEGYKDVKDLSVIVKFPIIAQEFLNKYCDGAPASFLAWTTTPWSIPTTMGLAIGADYEYIVVKIKKSAAANIQEGEQFIFIKNRLDFIMKNFTPDQYEIIKELKGSELGNIPYVHPFAHIYGNHPKVKDNANVYKTHFTDYVSAEDGTGIVTINGAYGDIDMEAAQKIGLPIVVNVRMDGTFTEEMEEFAGMKVKPLENRETTDVEIIKHLAHNNLLFAKEKYEHSYPHCWRCETPLLNYATSSWFVAITKIKDQMLANAKDINWSPEYIKEGRFGNWLLGARDWSISRQRFWASVIPIWKCEKCREIKVIGSVDELEKLSGKKITDIHKHIVDEIKFKCGKCDGEMKRIPDVLDTWFDSGSMPYAQAHYPFENKEKFEKNFPAKFIAEGIDQTRCWFYYMHAIATGIKNTRAYDNVMVNGIVLAEDGKKMSKRLKNYPDPMEVIDRYGADALRFYLLISPVMQAENLNFSESGVMEALRKNIMILWNVYSFYEMYIGTPQSLAGDCGGAGKLKVDVRSCNILDQWILARLNQLVFEVTDNMDKYNLQKASRPITDFIDDLSTWYLRRSRDRFKGDDEADKKAALATTKYVLIELAKVIAPFMPFIAEEIWQKTTGYNFEDENRSVHLEKWPAAELRIKNQELRISEKMQSDSSPLDLPAQAGRGQGCVDDQKILKKMARVRKIVEMGMALRAEKNIKVRQPLSKLEIKKTEIELENDYLELIKDELNVKEVLFVDEISEGLAQAKEGDLYLGLDTTLTMELKQEGAAREMVRQINAIRKEMRLTITDWVKIYYQTDSQEIKEVISSLGAQIMKDTLADEIISEERDGMKDVKVGEDIIKLAVLKIRD